MAKDFVENYYAAKRPGGTFKGCSSYADFRELLDKEKDVDAVKIMTPDHLHGVISIACMKRGKHVIMHKPLANRLEEAKLVIDTAREKGVATHFMPWEANGSMDQVMAWIDGGAIGTLREIHNWTNRPVWPQYTDAAHRYAARSGRLRLGFVAGPGGRAPLFIPNYTQHGLSRMVRLRRRLHGGYGPLQPVDGLQCPGAGMRRPASSRCSATPANSRTASRTE